MSVLEIHGKGDWDLFKHESGGHRYQRKPPTESGDRTHSSTITVAVFQESKKSVEIDDSEIELERTKGHGPGGQHRNKTESAIRATHAATGVTVFAQTERRQGQNKRKAVKELKRRVSEIHKTAIESAERDSRKQQVGSGQRGDKIRTVQVQNGRVTNHLNGKKMDVRAYLKGEIWRLH